MSMRVFYLSYDRLSNVFTLTRYSTHVSPTSVVIAHTPWCVQTAVASTNTTYSGTSKTQEDDQSDISEYREYLARCEVLCRKRKTCASSKATSHMRAGAIR